MTLWIALAGMMGLTVWALLIPLTRRLPVAEGKDIQVYQAQLNEIDRDERDGLIAKQEADSARLEANRRILAAGIAQDVSKIQVHDVSHAAQRKLYVILMLIAVPAAALGLYALWGSPQLPDMPLQTRLEQPVEKLSPQELVQRVEKALEENPNDIQALEVLAPIYRRVGEWDKAVSAYQKLARLQPENALRHAALGETIIMRDEGKVLPEALKSFDTALKFQPDLPMAYYYKGLEKQQAGQYAEASRIWQDLLRKAPDNASWIKPIRQRLVDNALAGIAVQNPFSEEESKDIMAATPAEREQFIRMMVERLVSRVQDNPASLELRLRALRALSVIGEKNRAQRVLQEGQQHFEGQAEPLRRLSDLAVGLELTGGVQQ